MLEVNSKGGTPGGDSKVTSDPENLWKFRIASNVAGLTGTGISRVEAGR